MITARLFLLHTCGLLGIACGDGVPRQAAEVGYITKTFSSTFSRRMIDLENTGGTGYQWYPWRFFGQHPHSAESFTITGDGSLVLGTTNLSASFATAAPVRTASRWVGVAFGGGAYFEATLKFYPERTAKGKPKEWPSFWSMAIEHAASLGGERWPGQPPGYMHFIETDFFEYDVWGFSPHHCYGGAIHEWYGIYKTTCPAKSFCGVSNAAGGGSRFSTVVVEPSSNTDYTMFHKFGFLWVPATPTTQGYAQYYFDGKAEDHKVMWDQYTSQPPPPGLAPWTFGIMDQQHLILIISTGVDQPMTVASVSAWQSSITKNLYQ